MLEARGLALSHVAGQLVCRDIDLELVPGQWTSLTGPNGTGKSTLCLALAGLLEPAKGEIRVDGEVLGPGTRARSRIAIVFQEPESQLVAGSVEAELSFPLENLGWERHAIEERVARLARDFDLEALVQRPPHELSGGEKSRLALATALAAEPRYLLLDEPGVYLGPRARARLRDLLRREVERGLSVLFVTQLEEEWRSADRWFRLAGRRLVEASGGEPVDDSPPTSPAPEGAPASGPIRLVAEGIEFTHTAAAEGSPLLLRGLDLTVRAGETILIGGESGSGKTTLLLVLAGVLEPRAGSVRTGPHGAARPRLAVALQSPEDQIVSPTVIEDVALGPRSRGADAQRATRLARAALVRAGLAEREVEHVPPSALSHGQRRRVAWAGVWAMESEIWLLDEPTSGLDREGVLALRNAIVSFSKGGGCAIVINQDPRLDSMPSRRLHLEGGRLNSQNDLGAFPECAPIPFGSQDRTGKKPTSSEGPKT